MPSNWVNLRHSTFWQSVLFVGGFGNSSTRRCEVATYLRLLWDFVLVHCCMPASRSSLTKHSQTWSIVSHFLEPAFESEAEGRHSIVLRLLSTQFVHCRIQYRCTGNYDCYWTRPLTLSLPRLICVSPSQLAVAKEEANGSRLPQTPRFY
jgi:hypothetical protein